LNNLCQRAEKVKKKISLVVNEPISLVIASKYADVDQLNQLVECGFNVFGENRVQELLRKAEKVKGAKWHFIGHLQKNKVKYIIGLVELIQSVDSIKLIQEIDRQAAKKGMIQKVLIQVNIAREEVKFGILPEELELLVNETIKLNNISLKGLMAVMPYLPSERLKPYFKELKQKFDILKTGFPEGQFEYLSAGMSNDWEAAILEGSNMVRLGSVIFGG
jgi:pyridoxal phosphate enzyme (YggS family)